MPVLLKGQRGIDFSSFRLSPPSAAVADGCKFCLRYSAGAASRVGHPSYELNRPKLITPAEYAALIVYYIVLANSEWYAGRVTEGLVGPTALRLRAKSPEPELRGIAGRIALAEHHVITRLGGMSASSEPDANLIAALADAGAEDGQADYELWRSCGYPRGWPMFCSWDQYPYESQDPAVAAYLRSHQAAMDAAAGSRYYVTDLYAGEGGIRRLRARGLAPIGWRTMAMSWNDNIPEADTVAALVQNGKYWFGQQADEDYLSRDLVLGAPDPPAWKDDKMIIVRATPSGKTGVLGPGYIYWYNQAEWAMVSKARAAAGDTSPVATITDAEWNAHPNGRFSFDSLHKSILMVYRGDTDAAGQPLPYEKNTHKANLTFIWDQVKPDGKMLAALGDVHTDVNAIATGVTDTITTTIQAALAAGIDPVVVTNAITEGLRDAKATFTGTLSAATSTPAADAESS